MGERGCILHPSRCVISALFCTKCVRKAIHVVKKSQFKKKQKHDNVFILIVRSQKAVMRRQ